MEGSYFTMPVDEALDLANQQVEAVIGETERYGGSQQLFWRHQVLETAKIVQFLVALATAQQRELDNLRTRLEH